MRRPLLVMALLLVAALVYYGVATTVEMGRNRLLSPDDTSSAYGLYVSRQPLIAGRPFVGDAEAPITIVLVLDMDGDASAELYAEKMAWIEEKYLDTGEARLYHKYYLPQEEYGTTEDRFIYAAAGSCYALAGGEDTIAFHRALFERRPLGFRALAEEHGADGEAFEACIAEPPRSLKEDAEETRLFRIRAPALHIGVDGNEAEVLVGNPGWARINQTIRAKQVTIGI